MSTLEIRHRDTIITKGKKGKDTPWMLLKPGTHVLVKDNPAPTACCEIDELFTADMGTWHKAEYIFLVP